MAKVTIEGSLTPSAKLARGERITVQDSADVRAFVAKGFAVVVDEETGETEPAPLPTPPQPPAKNASREEWASFLNGQGIEVPSEDDDDGGRNDLIELWEHRAS